MRLTETEARYKAYQMVSELGEGWAPVVWENLGWRYGAERGCAWLRANYAYNEAANPTGYTVYFNSATQILGRGNTPRKALEDARNKVQALIVGLTNDFPNLSMEEVE